jgi:hypothetical protein
MKFIEEIRTLNESYSKINKKLIKMSKVKLGINGLEELEELF